MQIQLLRHATLLIEIGGKHILVDPMLSEAEAMEPVQNAAVIRRIPMVDLPMDRDDLTELIADLDAVLVTHNHRDHWDKTARELLPGYLPIFCQPEDETAILWADFSTVIPIEDGIEWGGISLARTGGKHGSGEIGEKMGTVSGFVFNASGEPRLYIAGDTIWCPEVSQALRAFQPDVVVVNAGAAQFLEGGPITMSGEDIEQVCRELPTAQVLAIHMEAVNHCGLTRQGLGEFLHSHNLSERVKILADGEMVRFTL
jgi:L-ascorbate metabolism protein UlaG (beta-lactamase superfamily)